MTDHPITPPPELLRTLCNEARLTWMERLELAYAAGADQELEACCTELDEINCQKYWSERLRAARRPSPKPPSLKEQALEALERQCLRSISPLVSTSDLDIIRRALEALPDD
jgi:hypothetical protein